MNPAKEMANVSVETVAHWATTAVPPRCCESAKTWIAVYNEDGNQVGTDYVCQRLPRGTSGSTDCIYE